MKKAKSVVTFLTATSLLFGMSTVSFAQDLDAEKSTSLEVVISTQDADKLIYAEQDYVYDAGQIIGKYPVFEEIEDLSEKISSDVEKAVSELNLRSDLSENIVSYEIDESVENYAKVEVKVEKDDMVQNFEYYVDKANKKEITKEEFEKAIEEDKDSDDDDSQAEITMVPIRSNAEKLGWKVDWQQKTETEPSMAILTKEGYSIKVLVDSNTEYDVILTAGNEVQNCKLNKHPELQDDTLYVSSDFFELINSIEKDIASEAE